MDPAVEHIQQAKQQRERLWNDSVYFTSSKHPENAPEWACKPESYYEMEAETDYEEFDRMEEEIQEVVQEEAIQGDDYKYDYRDYRQKDEYYDEEEEYNRMIQEEEYNYFIQEEEYNRIPDFIRDSAEMNQIRPEDLDEIGESSTMGSGRNYQVYLVIFLTIFI